MNYLTTLSQSGLLIPVAVALFVLVIVMTIVVLLLKENRRNKMMKSDIPDDIFSAEESEEEDIADDVIPDDLLEEDKDSYPLTSLIRDDEDDEMEGSGRNSLVADDPDTPFNEESIHSDEQKTSPLPFKTRAQRAKEGLL